jgi:hypothetical protein
MMTERSIPHGHSAGDSHALPDLTPASRHRAACGLACIQQRRPCSGTLGHRAAKPSRLCCRPPVQDPAADCQSDPVGRHPVLRLFKSAFTAGAPYPLAGYEGSRAVDRMYTLLYTLLKPPPLRHDRCSHRQLRALCPSGPLRHRADVLLKPLDERAQQALGWAFKARLTACFSLVNP